MTKGEREADLLLLRHLLSGHPDFLPEKPLIVCAPLADALRKRLGALPDWMSEWKPALKSGSRYTLVYRGEGRAMSDFIFIDAAFVREVLARQEDAGLTGTIGKFDMRTDYCPHCEKAAGMNSMLGYWMFECGAEVDAEGETFSPCGNADGAQSAPEKAGQ